MRYFFLFAALLLAINGAAAQRPLPTARPDSLPATQAAPDTAAAIHRLFAAKRHRQIVLGVATAGAAIGALAVVSLNNQQPRRSGGSSYGSLVSGPILDEQAIAMVAIGVITVPVALGELLLFGGWGKKKERRVIADWERHRLTRFFKRRLKPKYFVGSSVPHSAKDNLTTDLFPTYFC